MGLDPLPSPMPPLLLDLPLMRHFCLLPKAEEMKLLVSMREGPGTGGDAAGCPTGWNH
jgi:hypothetical protein